MNSIYIRNYIYYILYEERKKQLNSTTNVSISEEISSGDDISSEIETFVVEFSCFFLSSYKGSE